MSNTVAAIDIDSFKWRLAEVITCCTRHTDVSDQHLSLTSPRDNLCTPRLRPPSFYYPETVYSRRSIIEQLCNRRADELRSGPWNRYPKEPATSLGGGRFLLYYPDENLCDGAAEDASEGFFNVENEPPWAIWLCLLDDVWYRETVKHYTTRCLLSWVPPQFVELANRGINVNPEACIVWLSDNATPFTRQLREAGLLGQE